MKQTYKLLFSCFLFTTLSCGLNPKNTTPLFTQVNELLEVAPDSAYALLEQIPSPESLPASEYNEYLLLQIQARHKASKDISSDTLIFQVKDFYLQKKDMEKAATAAFYSGRVQQARKKYTEAMKAYIEAESLAPQSIDENLKGLIQFGMGNLYYEQELQKEAIPYFKKAYAYCQSAGKHKSEASIYTIIGDCFAEIHQKDSAFYYYDQALTIAGLHNDSIRMAVTRQNMGVAYSRLFEYGKAIESYRHSITINNNKKRFAKYYYTLANTYDKLNQKDSTQYYVDMCVQALQEYPDNAIQASTYRLLSNLEEKNGNYKQALDYHKLYSKHLAETETDRIEPQILAVEKKYRFEQIQNAANRLLIEKQYILLILLLSVLAIIVLSSIYYQNRVKNREAINEATLKIRQLQEIAKKHDETKVSFRDILFRQFQVLAKAASLEEILKDDKKVSGKSIINKFNEIVYGQKEGLDWGKLYESMNALNNGFIDRLRENFPLLDESEIRICSLSYAGLDNTEISIIMRQSFNTIQVKKSNIRKKIGFPGHGNMAEYLDIVLK